MVFCLLDKSPLISDDERIEIDQNELLVAHRGREPGLNLCRNKQDVSLQQWADDVCNSMYGICKQLDADHEGNTYTAALKQQHACIYDPELTPSARMLAEMRDRREGFYHFAKRMSQQHLEYFNSLQLDAAQRDFYASAAKDSLEKQKKIEAADKGSFDDFLKDYFSSL